MVPPVEINIYFGESSLNLLKINTVSTYYSLNDYTVSTFITLKVDTVSTFNKLKVDSIYLHCHKGRYCIYLRSHALFKAM